VTAARRVAYGVAVIVVAALAAWLATRLWPTTVPKDLPQPTVNVKETFGAALVERADSIENVLRWLVLGGIVAEVVALGLWAWIGARWSAESAAGPIGTGFLLGMLGLGVVWIAQLPFSIVMLWWLRKHDITDVGYPEQILGGLLGLGGTFISLCVVLAIAMGFAKVLRWSWWLPTTVLLVGVTAAFAFVQPYLMTPAMDDASPRVQREADTLSKAEGVGHDVPISIWRNQDFADQPNAFSFGFGPSSHVVLFGALADHFTDEEVRSTVAHEIGHVAHHHILKSIGWMVITVLVSGFLVALFTIGRGGMYKPASVPLALLVVTVVGLLFLPLQARTSQRYEAEADWAALQATRDPQGLEDVMKELTRASKSDPDPPPWWHAIFDDHPSMKERVEMARAWKELHP
jgi:STE24 endopeptidase